MSNKKVAPPSKPKPKEPIIPESKIGEKARRLNEKKEKEMNEKEYKSRMGGGKIGKPIKYAVGGPTKPAWMRNR